MGKHHSSSPDIDKSIADFKVYWDTHSPDLEGSLELVELERLDRYSWVRLERDIFYPEGGGQPGDTGVLLFGDKEYSVVDTQVRGNHSWLKVVGGGDLSEGVRVDARVDKRRREVLSKNHSGQHLLSATFYQMFDADTTRAELGVAENQIDIDHSLTLDEVQRGFEVAVDMVAEDLDISTKILTEKDLAKLGLRGGKKIEGGVYRLVQIGTEEEPYDLNLCGGTHVSSTSKIMGLALTKLEGKKIRFVCGLDALKELNRASFLSHSLLRKIGVNRELVSERLDEMMTILKSQEREITKLEEELLHTRISVEPWIDADGFQYKYLRNQRGRKNYVSAIVDRLSKDELIVIHFENDLVVFASGSEDLVQEILVKARGHGVKGGGKGKVLMGKVSDLSSLDKMIEDL